MSRDTKQFEKLLAGTRSNLKALKLEIAAGAGGLENIQADMLNHEQVFIRRLNDLKALNQREATAPPPEQASAGNPPVFES